MQAYEWRLSHVVFYLAVQYMLVMLVKQHECGWLPYVFYANYQLISKNFNSKIYSTLNLLNYAARRIFCLDKNMIVILQDNLYNMLINEKKNSK